MQPVDTLVHADWVVPVEPDGVVLEGHSVAITGGEIVALGPRERLAAALAARREVALPGHVLVPGLVNAHTHAAMSLMKGLADDLPLMTWLQEHIWPVESQLVSPEFVHDGTLLAAAEMLRGGTTCFNDMYFFPDEAARAAREIGIRAVIGLIVVDFPTVWAGDADEYLARGTEVHDSLRAEPLVTTAFAPHAPYTVSDGPLERVRTLADELDVQVHMHVHETADEVAGSVSQSGRRPLERLADLGLLSHRLAAVHMTQLTATEIVTVAERGVHVVHCAESNLKLASGMCPVAALLAAGVNVAIGTDGAASNNDLSMLGETRTASLLAKGVAGDAAAVPAHTALRMATLGGARALGLDERTGSIEPGKAADLVAVDLSRIEALPVYHPISQVVYAADRGQVAHVWVAGRHVVEDGRLTGVDEQRVVDAARRWRARVDEAHAGRGR